MATCPSCKTRYPDGVATCVSDGAALVPDTAEEVEPELAPGTTVGEYRITGKIGAGGFGTVYRAEHPVIGKAAAIKVLSRQYSANPQFVSRFAAEARAVNQIRHRNIIDIFAFGALDDGRQYYVMELLEGAPLDVYLRSKGRLSPAEALPILAKIGRALDAAHHAGIAHRDLKPENVFLVFEEDGVIFPKLLDFGLAKLLGDASPVGHKTRTGFAMGTPLYMSPEQCRGKGVDHRTDIYSFGIMAHEMLTGRPPFDADDPLDLLFKHTSASAPPLSTVAPDLSPALDAPLLHMLEKDPARRPATLGEAMEALVQAAKSAGYQVPNVTRAGESGAGAMRAVPSNVPGPPDTQALAPTIEAPAADVQAVSIPTQTALQTSLPDAASPPPSRRIVLVAGAAVAAVAAIVATVLALHGHDHPAEAPREIAVSASVPQVSSAPAPPVVVPAATATAAVAAPPAEIVLSIQATPPDAEVWRDGALVGKASSALRLPRGRAVKLMLKAPGYREQALEVRAEEDQSIQVTLKKIAQPGPSPTKKGDLENPFQ